MKKLQVLLAIMLMLGLLVAPISSTNVNAQTAEPTTEPTVEPTTEPTAEPTTEPTAEPTTQPTTEPTAEPTTQPTTQPTVEPTSEPTAEPTAEPTSEPTAEPTATATISPTVEATIEPVVTTNDVSAAAIPSLTSGFQLQNLSTAQANIVINFYDQSGTLTSSSDTIAANSSKTYFPLGAVSSGFNGSVVVQSDQNLVGIVNLLGLGGAGLSGGASYNSISAAATSVNLPLVLKGVFNINSFVNVQNTSGSLENVTVSYPGTACSQTLPVPANSSKTFDQGADACLPAGFIGSAVASSAAAIVAAVVEYDADSLLAYGGFTTSSTNPVMPLVIAGLFATDTGIQIQNTGGTATDVTVTYTPSPGNPGTTCLQTQSIPAGQSVNFGVGAILTSVNGSDCSNPSGLVGSASVTGNSTGQLLVVIVNQATIGGANSSAYSGFDPAGGTQNVNIPLIIKDLPVAGGNLFTGFNLANVGGGTVSVTCTFAGQPTASVTFDAGSAAVNVVQTGAGSALPAGYVGSATCSGPGGSKLVAVVNEVGGAGDALLTYEGFNQ